MIWFTSDTHFWHRRIIQYCHRPISYNGVEEMNELIIANWNSKVAPTDEIYHLGDFAFCGKLKLESIVKQLNGIKYLIWGNHDKYKDEYWQSIGFQWAKHYHELMVHDVHQAEDDETKFQQYHQPIVLCHYPILSWNGMAYGSWHLHGHSHGTISQTWNKTGTRMDVGVDTNNLFPWSYDEIKAIMAKRFIVPVDSRHV